jgi:hypothetical protein
MWCLLDTNNINLQGCCIRPTTNVLADKLSRHLDSDDWIDTVLFAELDTLSIASCPHSTHYSPDTTLDGKPRRAKP